MDERYFQDIVGNRALLSRLSKDISEDSLSHAYILEGQTGSGRHAIALRVAAAIECEERKKAKASGILPSKIPCECCQSCKKILNWKSPDVKIIGLEEDRVTMGVETIRNLKNDMYIAPNDLSVKVYIIENADFMTVQAQNAFLLSLEEPPSYILFFLLCENSGDLLETVRSRAPVLRTQHIPSGDIEKYLLDNDSRASQLKSENEDDWKSLICVSSGSIGYALELLDSKLRVRVLEQRAIAKSIISLLSRTNKVGAIEAIPSFGSTRRDVAKQLSLIQVAIRDLLLLKKCENAPLCFFEDRESAFELSTSFTAKGLLALYDAAQTALDDLDKNSNVRLTMMNMMLNAGLL